MDRMSPLDAEFLRVEDGVNHMHVASCSIFEGPAPAFGDFVDALRRKLPLIPKYRQRARSVPLSLGRPVWADDPAFDIAYHVRITALPAPGGPDELKALMARLMSQELDRNRPLWETWVVEGLEGGQWAIVAKVHHCLVDGVSGMELLAAMLDVTPEAQFPPDDGWVPATEPSRLSLAAAAVGELLTTPVEQGRALRAALGAPGWAASQIRMIAGGFGAFARHLVPTPASSIDGHIGPQRRWTFTAKSIDDVRTIRKELGGTLNDVVLTAVSGGFRDLLLSRAENPDACVVRSLVPVSVRRPDQHGVYNNLVSAILAELPVHVADPVERLAAVQALMAELKASHMVEAGNAVTATARWLPEPLANASMKGLVRLLRGVPQPCVNTVTTNVPGSPVPLYCGGRRMLACLPYVPLAQGVRFGVAVASYEGWLGFGITGDYDTAPDVEVLREGIDDHFAALLKAATA